LSGPFLQGVLAGEAAALKVFADAVGLDQARREAYEPTPGALAYSANLAWLALYGEGGRWLRGQLRGLGCQLRPHAQALHNRYGVVGDGTRGHRWASRRALRAVEQRRGVEPDSEAGAGNGRCWRARLSGRAAHRRVRHLPER
jgi:hypothetical protein